MDAGNRNRSEINIKMRKTEEKHPFYLSIVVPLYNEEDSVEDLVCKILETANSFDFPYEIVLVDDGSTDRTWKIIEELAGSNRHIRAIKLRRNFGQTNAMVAGFDHAQGEIIVTMDGDLQNDPADIPYLLEKINEGYDIVSGWRKNRKDRFSRVFPSIVANRIISMTTGVRLHDYGCSLKAYRSKIIKSVNAYGEMHRFFPALASMTGARISEIPVKHYPRRYGFSKYGPGRIYRVLSDIFAMNLIIRFSSQPLKGFIFGAMPFAMLTGLFGALSALAFFHQWTAGKSMFFFIAAALCGVAAIHLVYLGVLGEIFRNSSLRTQAQLPEIEMKEITIKIG
jgi:glycosyltransferase involved in cell wall biosynthesis